MADITVITVITIITEVIFSLVTEVITITHIITATITNLIVTEKEVPMFLTEETLHHPHLKELLAAQEERLIILQTPLIMEQEDLQVIQ
jgi:hypothetical protein